MKNDHRRFLSVAGAALVLATGAAGSRADVEPNAAMLRYPDVSATHIVFSYANDLWVVPRSGGVAAPLASPPGQESFPRFSADGSTIAFVGNYDGNRDIYTIPVTGGVPTRVTHHPAAEILSDWAPGDRQLIYITNGFAGLGRQFQLWMAPVEGGLPDQLPVPYGGFGSISPDGTWLAYTPHSTDTRTWKRYRGGMATDIWLFNLKDHSSRRITEWEGTDTLPMWAPADGGGDSKTVYYLADNGPEHRLNIWAFDLASGTRSQVTTFSDDDVRWPSIGPGAGGDGEIVFQLGSRLMLLDLASGRSTEVRVAVPGDRPRIRTRTVDAAKNIQAAAVSPTGKRVIVEARGDLWSLPAKEGVSRALTHTDGVAERDPAWSPDNKWIAYFSDETGEYQLWIRPADARAPEEKKEEKEAKEPEENEEEAAAPEPAREPRQLSNLGPGYRFNPIWSPDSKWITFTDENGRLYLADVENGETKEIDKDPWMNQVSVSWSNDSQWMAYSKAADQNNMGCIWIANAKTGEKRQVTSDMFNSYNPAFDRKGEWLFFASNRSIDAPEYSDIDTTFVYKETSVLLMVPLRTDVKSPWLPKSDEEELKKDEKKDEAKKENGEKKEEEKKNGAPAAADDGVTGTWTGTATGNTPEMQQGLPFTLKLTLDKEGKVTGSLTYPGGSGTVSGTYDKATGQVSLSIEINGEAGTMTGTIKEGEAKGSWTVGEDRGEWNAKRTAAGNGDEKAAKDDKGAKENGKDKAKEVKIDFEDFEARAIQIPVRPGNFGHIEVADGEKLIYSRTGIRGEGKAGIKIYEYKADEKEEKDVTPNGAFQLTADGKKVMVIRGTSVTICDATAGGGKTLTVPTDSMKRPLDPRAEWKQIFTEAWRLQRDYFYEPTLHHVDWERMRGHYGAMIDDAASKEDVNWIIAEMISELNIGHAYLTNPGDIEDQPTVGVGLLGCDFEMDGSGPSPAYRIKKVIRGAPWDTDAVGPLSQPGVDVKEGDYLLAVNGIPVDATRDPWAALVGTVGKVTELTVNTSPTMDGKERRVLVKPVGSESDLRYRDYIESKRKYVEEKSGGRMGYIYVPNTGRDGQSDLFRQFYGQRHKDALIIDERWNGGGQIPTRFIELLNRPVVNYWARRDGNDWPWPPDAHFGPKCMLVNGLAGSGGDDFPWLFKFHKIGKVIGTRTWGGLVGISGNPRFIDGGAITVPTFGFYETDGTWGVEGHGVDPDIEVIDDPALMVDGGDPQLDAAINHLNEELAKRAYAPPKRPASPNRSGMGLAPQDR